MVRTSVSRLSGVMVIASILAACAGTPPADPSPTTTDVQPAGESETAAPSVSASEPPIPEGAQAYIDQLASLGDETVDTGQYQKDGPYTVAVLTQGPFNGWGQTFEVTAQWAAENSEDIEEALLYSSGGDVQVQVQQMEQALAQQPDAIVVHPNGDAVAGPAREAIEQGIPVVLCGNGLPDDGAFATVIQDHYWTQHVTIAEGLAEDIGYEGNVVIMGGNPAYQHTSIGVEAANWVFSKYPNIEIVNTVYSEYQIPKGKSDIEAILAANPEIDGVLTTGSEAAIGAIQAFVQRDLELPAFAISNDLNGFNRLAIEHGFKLNAAPNPAVVSAACVETAVDILSGDSGIPRYIEAAAITPESMPFTEAEVEDRYYEQFSDDFVGPPVAPDEVYVEAGLGS